MAKGERKWAGTTMPKAHRASLRIALLGSPPGGGDSLADATGLWREGCSHPDFTPIGTDRAHIPLQIYTMFSENAR
jgi:hypothetical protein